MDLHPQPDWGRLLGQHVEIRQGGHFVRNGIVDAVMPDNSIIWLSAEGPWPREMVEKSGSREVYARYQWDLSQQDAPDHPATHLQGRVT
ncbi:hypothetical protein [Paenarthrobacter nitroguajacolicus]|uniref:hypothetical protein n=1 Tax=Paenarthrobacter nitroguajacolicus TaxID=211146 RepID=UPI00248B04CD|nr:hypothetical protein [Paenarthrobacter nitroguajacolicus]MDI2036281.1 hypothetical protein [Paenarthrobacter nitroguajacolicus]